MTQIPQDQTVLITGAGGRLGRLLRRAAARDGTRGGDGDSGPARVVFQSRRARSGLTWAPGEPLSRLPRAGTVVALWGRVSGSAAELGDNPRLAALSNQVARACGARRLIHLSSAAVYGRGRMLSEDTPPAPVSDYGRSKLAMEQAVAALRRAGPAGQPAQCCLRLANVVGADSLAPALAGSGPIGLDRFADGAGPRRSYIAASDVLRVILGLAACPPAALPEIVNVAAPAPVPMEALARAAGRQILWRAAPPDAVAEVTLDATRLTRLLPGMPFLATAEEMIADWQMLETRA